MEVPSGQIINVVRRVYGSSSTALASEYLNDACPSSTLLPDGWTIGVGKGDADPSDPDVPTADPKWDSGTIPAQVGPARCCSPRHSTHLEPLHGIK